MLDISPHAKEGFVDHMFGDFNSLRMFIETIYSLPSLTSRDASANNLMETFTFSQPRRSPLLLSGSFIPDHYPPTVLNGTIFASSDKDNGTTATVSGTSTNTVASNTIGSSTLTVNKFVSFPVIQAMVSTAAVTAAAAILALSEKTGKSRDRSARATPRPRPPPSDRSPAGGDRTTLNHRCGNLERCTSRPTFSQPSPGSGRKTALHLPNHVSLPKSSIRLENGSSITLPLIPEFISGRFAGGLG
jgi:hypothetical protein